MVRSVNTSIYVIIVIEVDYGPLILTPVGVLRFHTLFILM